MENYPVNFLHMSDLIIEGIINAISAGTMLGFTVGLLIVMMRRL